jgi:hypothetical protein
MKIYSINILQATGRCGALALIVAVWSFLSSSPVESAETFTNWNWVKLDLSIPQTNLYIGNKISANISVSNTVDEEHIVFRSENICSSGFAWVSINEMPSGKKVEHLLVPSGFGSFQPFAGHKLETFDCNLIDAYAIKNAGIYSVTAIGCFPTNEHPTNNSQFVTVTTPPIIISLLPRPETNTPPK